MNKKIKILHYTLGFAPYRTGGLVGYVTSLMEQQAEIGHAVYALYPGNINLIKPKAHIKKGGFENRIQRYELVNSLPLALMGGIKEPDDFKVEVNKDIYINLLREINPDIIHVHTIMGIHKEFFEAAKILEKKIIFTSHDYFGLAPEPTFFHSGKSYDESNTIEDWRKASNDAFSTKKLLLFQLKAYPLIRKMKKTLLYFSSENSKDNNFQKNVNEVTDEQYKSLKDYYLEIFKMIDFYHFNSTVSKEVFLNNLRIECRYEVISITNNNISNRKSELKMSKKKIRVGYVGPNKEFKGFDDFLELANDMQAHNIEFHTFGYEPTVEVDNVIQHGKFKPSEARQAYENFDVLVVPSRWKETFGLVVLEGLSFGKIVFANENVGSCDILDEENIYKNNSDLKYKIRNIEKFVKQGNNIKTIDYHAEEIIKLYSEV